MIDKMCFRLAKSITEPTVEQIKVMLLAAVRVYVHRERNKKRGSR